MRSETEEKKEYTNLYQKLSLLVFKKYRYTTLLILSLVLLGLYSYTTLLKREGFPPIQTPIALTRGVYLVDEASIVDQDVTKPIAEEILKLDEISNVSTTAYDNFFTIATFFEESVTSDVASERVSSAIENIELPEELTIETSKIEVGKYLNEFNILLTINGSDNDNLDLNTLELRAQDIANSLQTYEDIEKVSVESAYTTGVNPQNGQTQTIQNSFSRYGHVENGSIDVKESVIIGLVAKPEADIIEFSESVNKYVLTLNEDSDNDDIEIAVSADIAPSIETQIKSLQNNLITGLLAVAFVTFLLITWRASIITAIFMLSVVAVTLLILLIFGYSLNTISLFALVLALGLFVDDATIIVEAIDASKARKLKSLEVIKESIGKVGAASFAGTMTTVLVFFPLLFVSGILGSFIRIMPITIVISLITSFILSLTLIPILSRYILLNNTKKSWSPLAGAEKFISEKISSWPLVFRKSHSKGYALTIFMVVVSFIALISAGSYINKIEFNIFPPSKDSDQLQLNITFNPGTEIDDAESITDEVNEKLLGIIPASTMKSIAFYDGSARGVTAYIELVPFTERDIKAPEIIKDTEDGFNDYTKAKVRLTQLDAGPPAEEFPFKMQIVSESSEDVINVAEALVDDLMGAKITRQNGTQATVTAVNPPRYDTISRTDGEIYYELQAGFDDDDTSALVIAAQQYVEEAFASGKFDDYAILIDDITFDFGQETENANSFSSLGVVFPIALLAMYILLALQFRSFLQPLLIFVAIPFSFFGVIAGLYYTDNPISFFVMIGFFGLIGIAVNNTILLTDYANQEKRAGKSTIEAISEATRKRFRPLVTTSITTVVALLPLALSDPFWEPLAYTIIFGLLSSTILVILSFPYYYLGAEWIRMRFSKGTRKARKHAKRA